MQQTNGVAVLATHLATTDRRALSEAWYNALHLAQPGTRTAAAGSRAHATNREQHAGAHVPRVAEEHSPVTTPATSTRATSRARTAVAEHAERRAPRTELAKRIERGLTRPPQRRHGAFSVNVDGGRVRVLLRSDGRCTRLVAVCAPHLRERVERALAQARFALATRGIRSEAA